MARATAVLAAVLMAGCVSAGKHRLVEDKLKTTQEQAQWLEGQLRSERDRATQFDAQLKVRTGELVTERATLEESRSAARKSEDELKGRVASAGEQLESVQRSNKDLQAALETNKSELSQRISKLVAEKDSVAARLAASQTEAGTLRKQGAEAAEKAARVERELGELRASKEAELKDLSAKLAAALEGKKTAEGLAEARGGELAAARSAAEALERAKEAERLALEQAKASELAAARKNYEDLAAGLKGEISAGEVTITQLKGKLTVNLVDRILFDSGSAEVKAAGRKVLDRVAAALKDVGGRDIRIEGHTDDVPISPELQARYPTNWELSTARATSVARHLQDRGRVDPKRLIATGYGEQRPIASNQAPEGRAQNRRIEIVLVPRD